MAKAMIQSTTEVRNFLKLKVTQELIQGKKVVINDLIEQALKERYGKEFTSFVKQQRGE